MMRKEGKSQPDQKGLSTVFSVHIIRMTFRVSWQTFAMPHHNV